MPLHDACHSIDSPNMRSILENIKFTNYEACHERQDRRPPDLGPVYGRNRPGVGSAAGFGRCPATALLEKGPDTADVDHWSSHCPARHRILVWLGLLDRRAFPGLDR